MKRFLIEKIYTIRMNGYKDFYNAVTYGFIGLNRVAGRQKDCFFVIYDLISNTRYKADTTFIVNNENNIVNCFADKQILIACDIEFYRINSLLKYKDTVKIYDDDYYSYTDVISDLLKSGFMIDDSAIKVYKADNSACTVAEFYYMDSKCNTPRCYIENNILHLGFRGSSYIMYVNYDIIDIGKFSKYIYLLPQTHLIDYNGNLKRRC